MNPHEGLTRIAQVIRWLGYGVAVLFALLGVGILFGDASDKVGFCFAMVVCGALTAGAGWAIAWVIDGFAKPLS